jgi:hypothetical protein
MALVYSAIEAALQAWLSAATGLPALARGVGGTSGVILEQDHLPQPAMPYLTLRVPPALPAGGPDELRSSYDGGQPNGSEVATYTVGQREFVASAKCFTRPAVGDLTARDYLARAHSALALPSVRSALNAAGLCFVTVETLQDLSFLGGPVGQGRGVLDVRFRCVDSASESTGYIATASPTPTWS